MFLYVKKLGSIGLLLLRPKKTGTRLFLDHGKKSLFLCSSLPRPPTFAAAADDWPYPTMPPPLDHARDASTSFASILTCMEIPTPVDIGMLVGDTSKIPSQLCKDQLHRA
jgi:hypothetical protein